MASLSKRELRRSMQATVAALDPDERRAQEDSLIAIFPDLPGFAEARSVLLFIPTFPEEPKTMELLSIAFGLRKHVLCPRVDRSARRLRLHRVIDPATDLQRGVLGIPEPRPDLREELEQTVDWALVPGLAFDERGFRLGRGGGYYDRLLPLLRPDAVCWALCLSCQLVSELPVERHDVPINGVSTPDRRLIGVGTRRVTPRGGTSEPSDGSLRPCK
jgi:5-formyltetrahydrofolate cyclo-ligase